MSNLACFIRGCTNPVMGQCHGYKGSCSQFYCADHSISRLCTDCAQRKAADEKAAADEREERALYNRYTAAAQQCYNEATNAAKWDPAGNWLAVGFFLLVVLAIVAFIFGQVAIGWILSIVSVIFAASFNPHIKRRQEQLRNEVIARYVSRYPGFEQFYFFWLQRKGEEGIEYIKKGLKSIGTAVVLGAAVADSYRVERNIRTIADNTGSIAESTDDIAKTVRKINQKL